MVSAYIMQKNVLAISDMTVLDSLTATTVSNEAIRRLLRRGGATRCSAHGIQEIRAFLFTHLCQLIRDAFIYAKHEGTLCVTGFHIECAVKLQLGCSRLYGFSSPALYMVPDANAHLCNKRVLTATGPALSVWGAVREAQDQQHEHGLLIRCKPFKELVQQIGLGFAKSTWHVVFQEIAITALQTKVEDYVVGLIKDSLHQSIHAQRTLMFPKDFHLALRMRGERH